MPLCSLGRRRSAPPPPPAAAAAAPSLGQRLLAPSAPSTSAAPQLAAAWTPQPLPSLRAAQPRQSSASRCWRPSLQVGACGYRCWASFLLLLHSCLMLLAVQHEQTALYARRLLGATAAPVDPEHCIWPPCSIPTSLQAAVAAAAARWTRLGALVPLLCSP